MQKPDVDEIEGLSPAISIDQKAHSANPRSTVATITEIYDYLRVLFARIGVPHCVTCKKPIQKLTVEEMVNVVIEEAGSRPRAAGRPRTASGERRAAGKIKVLAPVVRGRKGEYYQLLYDLYNSGFAKVRIDGEEYLLSEQIKLGRYKQHTIEVVVDTVPVSGIHEKDNRQRLAEALETALECFPVSSVALIVVLVFRRLSRVYSALTRPTVPVKLVLDLEPKNCFRKRSVRCVRVRDYGRKLCMYGCQLPLKGLIKKIKTYQDHQVRLESVGYRLSILPA
jgi:excinuclease UvrABC ATPase subunit